jgi:HisJ family histidinol phosphate phosphatase
MTYKYTDYHIHTNWSADIKENGPNFEEYIKIAEQERINICFLEHYELYYVEKDKTNPFYGERIDDYLEEIDKLKETYDFIMSGLEVEYYQDREIDLLEFMDDYGKDIDFIAGTVHEWIIGYPVTTRDHLVSFIEKKPVPQIIKEFFDITKLLIQSKIFKNICHIDTVFRYINENDIKPPKDVKKYDQEVLDLGRLCIKNKISVEYNLSGIKFPIGRSFPSKAIIYQLKEEGANIFVGSDSHDISYFQEQISEVKSAYEFLSSIRVKYEG